MDVWSTVFEETCGFINGVGGCTIVVGSHHGGAVANTPPTTPTSTHVTPSFTTSTHASTSPSQMPKPVSPSSTQPLPSPTPPSASPTAGVAPPDPPRSDSSTPRASNTFSASSLTPNPGITTNVTVTITSAPSLATPTLEPDTSDANTSAASSVSVSATPSTLSPSPTTSLLPLSTPSGSQLPAAAIASIAVGAGAISLVLLAGCIWWVARRRRLPPTVAGSSTPQAGVSDASILSRAISTTTTTRRTLPPVENEGEKGEYSLRSSSETLQGSVRVDRSESMVVEASNFESDQCSRSPPSRSLPMETVPFLAAPSLSGKGVREAASTSTITDIAFSLATTETTTVTRQSTAEMEGGARTHCHLWNGDANEDGEADFEGSGRPFRYETDAGIRLDGGPLGELREYEDSDYDQRTIASVETAPPPYSRY